jgi:hypothetical protein
MTAVPMQMNINLEYLQTELARLDILLQRQTLRWQLAGQDPADPFRGLHLSGAEAEALLNRPFAGNWGQMINLSPEQAQAFDHAESAARQHAEQIAQTAQQHNQPLRLRQLQETFGLDQFEVDALLICLASALDLRYEKLYSYLQDDITRKHPSVNLILDMLTEPNATRLLKLDRFTPQAPLFKYKLLNKYKDTDADNLSLLNQSLYIDPAITAWLLGRYQPHRHLENHVVFSEPDLVITPVDRLLTSGLDPQLQTISQNPPLPLLVFHGPDKARQDAAARIISHQTNLPLLKVNLTALIKNDLPPHTALTLALRDAALAGAIPYLTGWDECLQDKRPPESLLTALCNYDGLAIVAGATQWRAAGIDRKRALLWFEFPIPLYTHRRALWRHFLEKINTAHRGDSAAHVALLAGQFSLTAGEIRDVVATATDRAIQRGSPITEQDLFVAARIHSSPKLTNLARKIEPRYQWEDIILPGDQLTILREIIATVQSRPLVLEEWGVGQKLAASAGVTLLFAGPPGTGKTMAAEIIARKLGLDLYKIDLSTLVSKYIGETEKNLEKIFSEAQNSSAILFFDEADAIFGKRSEVKDAHDRYANIEVSYLLQRMEAYDGVTILATNLRANLDDAFTRRLQFAVDFPFPEAPDRLRIWQALFPPTVPHVSNLDFKLLARRFKLAGGSIRNIITSAAYLAAGDGGQVTMRHLMHGTRRELQKMGRLVNEADMQVDVNHQNGL